MMNPLTYLTLLTFSLLPGLAVAQASVSNDAAAQTAPVAVASAFQVIDDARAENVDADLTFVRQGIARNEAAIEAAKAVLKTSFDADIRMLAGDSLKLHNTELRSLKAWLDLHGPKGVPTTTPPVARVAPAAAVAGVSSTTQPAVTPAATPVLAPAAAASTVASPSVPMAEPAAVETTPAAIPPAQPSPSIPATPSPTEPALPGAHLTMEPPAQPTLQLLDVPTVPTGLIPAGTEH